jgi:signal transduction histidine kinase
MSKTSELESKLAVATEALRRSEERATVGQLALEVIHDVRNPLEALRNLTYLMTVESENPEQVRKYAALAEEQIAIVADVADSTLGFAREPTTRRPTDLVQLAEAALRIHQRTIEGKGIHLVKDLPHKVVLPVHSGEILQVISNFIANSLDALPFNGTLSLRLRKSTNGVHLLVADNGHGIPDAYAGNIFEPFFTTKEDRGTGLGLALSKRIIESHRGTIKMRSSVQPGKSGTTFKISIPA